MRLPSATLAKLRRYIDRERRLNYNDHAPKGGIAIKGKQFVGGQFIPAKDMAKATPEQKAQIKQGEGQPGGQAKAEPTARDIAAKQIGKERAERSQRAVLPEAAKITPADVQAAKATPKIEHPQSPEDVDRFIDQVRETPVYKSVVAKMQALGMDSPGGNNTLWSVGKHAKGDILGALKAHGAEAYDHIEWTPERKALHGEIINSMLNPHAKAKPGERPKVVILMGPPGSGKTMAGQPQAAKLGVEFTTVNADDIKAKLPEYEGWNAGAVHEESALLAEGPLQNKAMEQRHNMLMDLTGGNTAKMEKMADGFHQDGYDVHIISIALPAFKSTGRAWDRFAKNAFGHADPTGKTQELGRFVPPNYVNDSIDGKPEKTYNSLKQEPFVKSHIAISTDVPRGEKPRVIDQGGTLR